ncbi:MAG TPA: (Fe-S)-binding protein, partial [Burkholderiales bacterium]|nr:(Fe-S)-binding protein [Burkholderiales bacterium]
MQVSSNRFKQAASEQLANQGVQKALRNAKGKLVVARSRSILELDNFEEIREAAARIRDFGLQHMDVLLEEWEKRAEAAGTIVHWAESPQQVNQLVLEIARKHAVRK